MPTIRFIAKTSHTLAQDCYRIMIKYGWERKGYTIVKHLPDSSVFRYRNGSWKDYWESESSKPFPQQSHCDCCFRDNGIELVGCHVIDKDKNVYIYPVCQSCNILIIIDYLWQPRMLVTNITLKSNTHDFKMSCLRN